jgi:pimeloyl-ACP methyl ester carboxylesterase
MMATYVLIPGFWLDGWAWQDVAEPLRKAGHSVYPLTLTGLAERAHLGSLQVNLSTHIADAVSLLTGENLRDVLLVGHSYAANVITGAAEQVPERIKRLVYVDTWPLSDGVAQIDGHTPDSRKTLEQTVKEQGEGWYYPLPP